MPSTPGPVRWRAWLWRILAAVGLVVTLVGLYRYVAGGGDDRPINTVVGFAGLLATVVGTVYAAREFRALRHAFLDQLGASTVASPVAENPASFKTATPGPPTTSAVRLPTRHGSAKPLVGGTPALVRSRAGGLVPTGIVLTLVLGVFMAVGAADSADSATSANLGDRPVVWRPTSVEQVQSSYTVSFGDGRLDLTGVDFTEAEVHVTIRVDGGRFVVSLPQKVDVEVRWEVELGEVDLFEQEVSSVYDGQGTSTDLGADGAGGGWLRLTLAVNLGNAEVHRA